MPRSKSASAATPRRAARADPARVEALKAWLDYERGGALREAPPAHLGPAARRLYHQLLMGLVRHRRLLGHVVNELAGGRADRADRVVRAAAMLGVLQLRMLAGIPPHAAVNESVEAARRLGYGRAAGWVNGVLRAAQRRAPGANEGLPLAVRTSHPDWMVARWRERYGQEAAEAICEANNRYTGPTVRVEPARATPEQAAEALAAEGIAAAPHPAWAGALRVEQVSPLLASRPFAEGWLYVQDASSQVLTAWTAPLWQGWVVEACAAPGGKLTHLQTLAPPGVRLLGIEPEPGRLARVRENLTRLRRPPVPLLRADAARLPLRPGSPGAVLLDVPCMSTGMIRKSPDVKWNKRPADIDRYATLQAAMLDAAAGVAGPGAWLLYSTCSLEPEENERQVEAFLARHPAFARVSFAEVPPPEGLRVPADTLITPAGDFQTLPDDLWMGLYAALLRRGP